MRKGSNLLGMRHDKQSGMQCCASPALEKRYCGQIEEGSSDTLCLCILWEEQAEGTKEFGMCSEALNGTLWNCEGYSNV